MELLHSHCAGLDVHKETVVACIRHLVEGKVTVEVKGFQTTTQQLMELSDWLSSQGVTHIAMEATGFTGSRSGTFCRTASLRWSWPMRPT